MNARTRRKLIQFIQTILDNVEFPQNVRDAAAALIAALLADETIL